MLNNKTIYDAMTIKLTAEDIIKTNKIVENVEKTIGELKY